LLPAPAAGGPSRRYLCESFPGCLDPCHGGTWSACACFFLHVIGLLPYTIEVGFPAFARQNDFLTDPFFETAVISLCSGLQVCSPPRSFPPQRLIASGQPGLLSEQNMLRFLRMHRTLLPIRIQAIDGVGTCTPQDSQPCRLLQCNQDFSPTKHNLARNSSATLGFGWQLMLAAYVGGLLTG